MTLPCPCDASHRQPVIAAVPPCSGMVARVKDSAKTEGMEDDEIKFPATLPHNKIRLPHKLRRVQLHWGHPLALIYILIVADLTVPGLVAEAARRTSALVALLTHSLAEFHAWTNGALLLIADRPMITLLVAAWPFLLVLGVASAILWYRQMDSYVRGNLARPQLLYYLAGSALIFWALGSLFPETAGNITSWLDASPTTELLQVLGNWGLLAGAIIAIFLLIQFSRSRDERVADEVARAWSTLLTPPNSLRRANTGAREAVELLHAHGRPMNGVDLMRRVLDDLDLRPVGNKTPANLRNATFEHSSLNDAKFDKADLSNAQLSKIVGANISFDNADLSKARLSSARLVSPSFRGAIFDDTRILKATISAFYPHGGEICDVKFDETTFKEFNPTAITFRNVSFTNCIINFTSYFATSFSGVNFSDASISKFNGMGHFWKVIFSDSKLSDAGFSGGTVTRSEFIRTRMNHVSFDGTAISSCDFSNAVMRRTRFRGGSLKGVNFTEADLTDSIFDDAHIDKSVNFTRAALCGVDLSKLDPGALPTLRNAYHDSLTKIPVGTSFAGLGMIPIGKHPRYRYDFEGR